MSGWAVLRAHRTAVRTLCLAADGLQLLSGDEEGFVVLWSLESRRPLAIWRAHSNALLTSMFWTPDTTNPSDKNYTFMVTHARDNKLRIWRHPQSEGTQNSVFNTDPIPATTTTDTDEDLESRYPKPWLVYTQDVNALNFCSVALSPHSRVLAAPATTASERIDVYTLDMSFSVSRPFKALNAADALPLDTQLNDEAAAMSRRGLLGAVMALLLTTDLLVAGYESGHVAAFDLVTGQTRFIVQQHKAPILSLALSGSTNTNRNGTSTGGPVGDPAGEHVGDHVGPYVFVSAADRTLSTVDLHSGEAHSIARLSRRGVASIDVLDIEEGHFLAATAGWDKKIRLFTGSQSNMQDMVEVESFDGGRQDGITAARIGAVDQSKQTGRRLRPLPPIWIVVAGKDGRVGLHAYTNCSQGLINSGSSSSSSSGSGSGSDSGRLQRLTAP